MKLSVFTVSMPEYDIPSAIKVLREIGYDGVEWRVADNLPEKKPAEYTFERRYWDYNLCSLDVKHINKTIKNIKKLCDNDGLEICSLTGWFTPWQTNEIEMIMKAASYIGCRNIRVWAPDFNGEQNYNALFDSTINQIKVIEKLARIYKVRMNFETHMDNIIPSASAAYRLVSKFDPEFIGVIFDPGNMVTEGFENYSMGLDILGHYLAHVHIKNAVWKLEKVNESGMAIWKNDWAPLDQGCANIEELLKQLNKRNYKGYISVEDFSNEEETYTKLKNANVFLKKMIRKLQQK